MTTNLTQLSDEMLLAETTRAAAVERQATAELLTLLIEVERRGLHLGRGYPSMFVFCTRTLRLSEQAAYSRITAARAARRFPQVLTRLSEGALSLSSVGLLAPHLTDETVDAMLEAAAFKTTREVERLIAAWIPQPDVPAVLRALPRTAQRDDGLPTAILQFGDSGEPPVLGAAQTEAAAPRPPVPMESSTERPLPLIRPRHVRDVAPLAPRRYLLKLTIGQETYHRLERTRALLRHSIPNGDTEQILNRALGLLLDHVQRRKCAQSSKPRSETSAVSTGRHIPAGVRRAVWRRDGGRCVFRGEDRMCGETAFLEFHHVVPFAAGGPTNVANLQLRCRAHNGYEVVANGGTHKFSSMDVR